MPNETPKFSNPATAEGYDFTGEVDQEVQHPTTGYNGSILNIPPDVAKKMVEEGFYLVKEKTGTKATASAKNGIGKDGDPKS